MLSDPGLEATLPSKPLQRDVLSLIPLCDWYQWYQQSLHIAKTTGKKESVAFILPGPAGSLALPPRLILLGSLVYSDQIGRGRTINICPMSAFSARSLFLSF